MELLGPDFQTIILAILIFFGGCMAFEPSEPVVIQTPKSVAVERINDKNGLIIEFKTKDSISLVYRSQAKGNDYLKSRGETSKSFRNPSVQDLSDVISAVVKLNGGTEGLNAIIEGENQANAQNFKKLIEALRRNRLFRFQLITKPKSSAIEIY